MRRPSQEVMAPTAFCHAAQWPCISSHSSMPGCRMIRLSSSAFESRRVTWAARRRRVRTIAEKRDR
eukprot:2523424-Prymnesium_polylepis.1